MAQRKPLVMIGIDTGLPIALIFEKGRQYAQKVQDLLDDKKLQFPMFMTKSVDDEFRKLMNRVLDRLGKYQRQFAGFLHRKFITNGHNQLTINDASKLQRYFGQRIWRMKKERLKEELRAFEYAIISRIRETFQSGQKSIPIHEMLKNLHHWTLEHYTAYFNQYDALKRRWPVQKIEPNKKLIEYVADITKISNLNDVAHIVSSLIHSINTDTWVIFCSLDYAELVGKPQIESVYIHVSDPLYFYFSHSKLLSKCKGHRPREYISKKPKLNQEELLLLNLLFKYHQIQVPLHPIKKK